MMNSERELKKQYQECGKSGYFFFIPERELYHLMDFVLKDDDIILLKPVNFKDSYFELIENECSVADASVDTDG